MHMSKVIDEKWGIFLVFLRMRAHCKFNSGHTYGGCFYVAAMQIRTTNLRRSVTKVQGSPNYSMEGAEICKKMCFDRK